MLAEKTERERAAKEAAEKKRKADTERAEALFATVSEMWDKQGKTLAAPACDRAVHHRRRALLRPQT